MTLPNTQLNEVAPNNSGALAANGFGALADALSVPIPLDRVNITSPTLPADGEVFLVAGTGATGDFAGLDGQAVLRVNGAFESLGSLLIWPTPQGAFAFNGTEWAAFGESPRGIRRRDISATTNLTLADVEDQVFSTGGTTQPVNLPAQGTESWKFNIRISGAGSLNVVAPVDGTLATLSNTSGQPKRIEVLWDGTEIAFDLFLAQ